jgi:UDP-N-acetylmuramoyl-L-alanyl-D-glutamate--2,6-diaminopimelate ligase
VKPKPLRPAGVSLCAVLADDLSARPRDVRIASCTNDFRQVQRGDAFVALTEAHCDGHDVATDAVRRGAAAVICERFLPVFDVPQFVVADTRSAYGRLCQALVGNPSRQLKVIGVTGTHGKTTVVQLLASILNEAGMTTGMIDSYNYCDGTHCQPTPSADLTPPALAHWLGRMAANGVSHAILELSSQALSQSLPSGVELDVACITHVGRDHLDWHGSLENYRQAEKRVLDHLRPEGVAILNADCQVSMRLLSELDQPALTTGMRQPAEITAQVIEQHINEQVFVLTAGDESVGVRTQIIGDHHVSNCLTAAATCLAYGVDLVTIARGLEAVDRLPGRMERVVCGQDFAVLVDAANTPDSLRACLRAARHTTSGRLICVFGADHLTQSEQRPAMGRVAGSLADVAVVTSNGPRPRTSDDFSRDVVHGFADPRKAHVILDRAEAIAWAFDQASEGDTVVLAGTGDRAYPSSVSVHAHNDDSDVARYLLTQRADFASSHRIAA